MPFCEIRTREAIERNCAGLSRRWRSRDARCLSLRRLTPAVPSRALQSRPRVGGIATTAPPPSRLAGDRRGAARSAKRDSLKGRAAPKNSGSIEPDRSTPACVMKDTEFRSDSDLNSGAIDSLEPHCSTPWSLNSASPRPTAPDGATADPSLRSTESGGRGAPRRCLHAPRRGLQSQGRWRPLTAPPRTGTRPGSPP